MRDADGRFGQVLSLLLVAKPEQRAMAETEIYYQEQRRLMYTCVYKFVQVSEYDRNMVWPLQLFKVATTRIHAKRDGHVKQHVVKR